MIVLIGAVRSESFTRRLAARLETFAGWVFERLNRDPIPNLGEQIVLAGHEIGGVPAAVPRTRAGFPARRA